VFEYNRAMDMWRQVRLFHDKTVTERRSRNGNPEYLPQRRKARKGRRKMVNIVRKNIYLSLPNLACLGPWREQHRNPRVFTYSSRERKEIPGLEPKRADVILAGACLIESIMTSFHADEVIVSDQGVRYGLLYEQLDRQK
jgi:hypothetical protein